ncbi:ABC transporter ATP-binding protein [Mesorhizobium sp. LNJC405B00]|uniref:ABC transporter ATP-binding protein n=1 Tax=Mesorhizobium sp. LNJC405B00 TaxID=1287281 RepID=UPI0003CE4CEC|nr:ABC transporter ATP-binding protein [Mesorhizobium sp. LNJC405B00]ESX84273.1 ABC transporter ATP-binding protein [Mesorhizobium sp. LNJC405B00]
MSKIAGFHTARLEVTPFEVKDTRALTVDREKRALIVASDIAKSYREFIALGPVSVEIGEGEFVSILGPSGCGKSTLMLITAGLLQPTKGSVKVNGEILTNPITDVGIVFQDHLLLEFRTAIDNVLLQQEIRRLDRAATEKRAKELFEKLGLSGAEARYPRQLSGGMQQRVSIARALVHDPTVLLMDEPFGALDAISRTQIRHDLETLWMETRKSVLFITHSIEEAIGLSDRILVMSNSPGRIVKEIRIDLPRPRPAYLGQYPEFSAYADEIYKTFEALGVYRFGGPLHT